MMTLLKSQDLWELVEQGYPSDGEEARLRENKKKDAKALAIIQQAVHDSMFSRIAAANSAKDAWVVLKEEFHGDSKVAVIRLQSLRREFENLVMKEDEAVADFLSRCMDIVSQIRSYGESITDQTVVEKVLRSLPQKFDHVVASIEESKDLAELSFNQLMGSLQSHEARIKRSPVKVEERAFQTHYSPQRSDRGGFRGRSRGRGSGRGRGRSNLQCSHCSRFGHVQNDCWYKDQQLNWIGEGNEVEKEEDERLFVLCAGHTEDDVWFVDSGCSNHMTGQKVTFDELDEAHKMKVQLGNKKELRVEGKGTVKVETGNGKVKSLQDVQYVLDLG